MRKQTKTKACKVHYIQRQELDFFKSYTDFMLNTVHPGLSTWHIINEKCDFDYHVFKNQLKMLLKKKKRNNV